MKDNKRVLHIWAAAHVITKEQEIELNHSGIILNLSTYNPELHNEICNITIETNLQDLASKLLKSIGNNVLVQPAGNPAFQFELGIQVGKEREAGNFGPALITPKNVLYAHSNRVSIDVPQPDGSILKTSTFKHAGFIKMFV